MQAVEALHRDDLQAFLAVESTSGESSWKLLQNLHVPASDNQEMPLALEMSRRILADQGAWRMHGGGFAGTILAFVPISCLNNTARRWTACLARARRFRSRSVPKARFAYENKRKEEKYGMLLIKNAKLYTMGPEGILDGGDVLMDGGKVVRVGKGLSQGDCKVIDARGAYVTPGYVDAHCHVGMWENGLRDNDGDGNERTDPITPELRALDGLHPLDRSFEEAYQNGVITAAAGPGSANVLGGQFLAIKTWGRGLDSRIVKEPLAMKSAFGENPKRVYGSQNKMPQTRMASAALLRQTLIQAQEYMQKRELPEDKRPARSLRMEALVPVLKGEMILKMHAHRAEDILTAIRIAKEFGLKATIEHCTEGYMIADELRNPRGRDLRAADFRQGPSRSFATSPWRRPEFCTRPA